MPVRRFVFGRTFCALATISIFALFGPTEAVLAQDSVLEACRALAKKSSCESKLNPILEVLRNTCEAQKKVGRCDELIARVSPIERTRFLDCSQPEDLCPTTETPIESCGTGAKSALVKLSAGIVSLPLHLVDEAIRMPAVFADCNNGSGDSREKTRILNSFGGALKPPEMTDQTIANMSCADIQRFMETKIDTLLRGLNDRRLKLTTESSTADVLDSELLLTPQEKAALAYDLTRQAPFRQAACYNRKEKIRFICDELTSNAVLIAGGGLLGAATGTVTKAVSPLLLRDARLALPARLSREFPDLSIQRSVKGETRKYHVVDEIGRPVAAFEVDASRKSLHVIDIYINQKYRKRGIAKALFEQALADHPTITTIRTSALVTTNRVAIDAALAAKKTGEDVIRSTPAYKIRANLGFTEIAPDSITPNDYGFTVRRPYARPSGAIDNALAGSAIVSPVELVISPELEEALATDFESASQP